MAEGIVVRKGSPFVPISATGGTISDVTIGGVDYRIHAFTSTGTSSFEVVSIGTTNGEADVLVVGGGGSGGARHGGGGGAGGLSLASINLIPQNYTIVVGNGGPGTQGQTVRGVNGEDTTAFGFTAIGGGGGANDGDGVGAGGSGGGGTYNENGGNALQPGTNPSAQLDLGSNGGGSYPAASPFAGSGGGGATEPGVTATGGDNIGDGGNGYYASSLFGTSFGESGFFAGGGGGGYNDSRNTSLNLQVTQGGLGGGGNGSSGDSILPEDGLANTGGGGGGNDTDGNNTESGDGGSGIVLIRYRI